MMMQMVPGVAQEVIPIYIPPYTSIYLYIPPYILVPGDVELRCVSVYLHIPLYTSIDLYRPL
jgi:hypothetical protein